MAAWFSIRKFCIVWRDTSPEGFMKYQVGMCTVLVDSYCALDSVL